MSRKIGSLFFGLWALCAGGQTQAEEIPLDAIVAVVNNGVILRSELDQESTAISKQLQARGTPLPPKRILERQVLERMIDTELQHQEASRMGVVVDDLTVAQAIENIAKRNKIGIPEMRRTLEAEGLSFNRFREETRRQMITSRLQEQQVRSKITVTDQEVEQFLRRHANLSAQRSSVLLAQLLVSTPEGADTDTIKQAKNKATELYQKLKAGANFAELVVANSNGPNALNGGEMGWLDMGEVPNIASEVARTLNKGEISEPIRSSNGYHLFKLMDYRGSSGQWVTQYLVRHILIRTSELVSDDDARTRLEQLRYRIEGGEDFSALARSHSDDTGSAIKGGSLGWINPGDMVPGFAKMVVDAPFKRVTAPFQTNYGWHILEVLEQRQHDNAEEAMRQKARNSLKEKKVVEATELWRRRLRDEAYVEIHLNTDNDR